MHFYYAIGAIVVSVALIVWVTTVYMLVKRRAVYLVDFAVATPPDQYKVLAEIYSLRIFIGLLM